jgi:hypothetical protein
MTKLDIIDDEDRIGIPIILSPKQSFEVRVARGEKPLVDLNVLLMKCVWQSSICSIMSCYRYQVSAQDIVVFNCCCWTC